MSCNTCQTNFSFFTKNVGCPSCGYSSCSKCLKYKCDIPDIGKKKVCGRCYNKLNNMNKSSPEDTIQEASMSSENLQKKKKYCTMKRPLAPIDITMKLDSLENPVKPPIVIYKHTDHWDALKRGLEPADQQIVDRLRKLKDEECNISVPTIDEIKQRLALLKDQDPQASGSNVINIHQVDVRTDQEKVDDLIQEYLAEIELPSTSDLCKEIQMRRNSSEDNELVTKVSAMEIETPPNMEDEDENEDEDEDENEDEAEDEDEDEDKDEDKDEDEYESKDECLICSRTADELDLYKCTGCKGDIYCSACFESFHDDFEMEKHKAIRFVKEDEKDKLSSAKMSLIQKLLTDS